MSLGAFVVHNKNNIIVPVKGEAAVWTLASAGKVTAVHRRQ